MRKLLVTIALGATVISTQALAQDDRGSRGGWMQQDMTRQQAQQMADQMFQRFDTNHDGVLTRQEAEQAASQFGGRGSRMIDRMFGDAQSITLQQAEAQALARFDRQDLNHDGTVTADERQQARSAMRAQRQSPGAPPAPQTPPPPPGQ
jgi:Ca2+-binding EF-hand superfamily protein